MTAKLRLREFRGAFHREEAGYTMWRFACASARRADARVVHEVMSDVHIRISSPRHVTHYLIVKRVLMRGALDTTTSQHAASYWQRFFSFAILQCFQFC